MKRIIACFIILVSIQMLFPGCTPNELRIDNTTRESLIANPAEVLNTPDRKDIYFATGNDYYDLYVDYSWVPGPEITLLSREYIDPENIQVSVDIQSDYSVFVTKQETGASLTMYSVYENDKKRVVQEVSRDVYDFPLYLYQTYAGLDWAVVGQKYAEYCDVMEKCAVGEVDQKQAEAALNQYNYAASEYINDYSQLVIDDLPTYHEYLIQIYIDRVETDEEFSTVQVMIDDTVYDINIGKVCIRQCTAKSTGREHFATKMGSPYWLNSFPYGSGIEQCQSATFSVQEDITLTGLHFLENTTSTVRVLDVVAVIADDEISAYTGAGIRIDWDGVTPFM